MAYGQLTAFGFQRFGDAPQPESDYRDIALEASPCANMLEYGSLANTGAGHPAETGPVHSYLNLDIGGKPTEMNMVSACLGPADGSVLAADCAVFGGQVTAPATRATIGGISGERNNRYFCGYSPGSLLTYVIGADVPASVLRPATGASTPSVPAAPASTVPHPGPGIGGSLATNAGVAAVLTATRGAAMVEMGTVLLRGSLLAPDSVGAAITAAESASGTRLARPVFAGYGWTPDDIGAGTATFVTVYSDEQQAADSAAVLNKIWLTRSVKNFDSPFTSTHGTVVDTVVSRVAPTVFSLTTLNLLTYPGFAGTG